MLGALDRSTKKIQRIFAAFLACFSLSAVANAGIGPENLLVVVNADSSESRTIANHYVELRKVPSSNVVFLENVPNEMITNLEDFRERVLRPVLQQIDNRGLSNQIRCVAYSSHFPYAVRIKQHHSKLTDPDMQKVFTPTASINGLTYLFRFVLADREEYLNPGVNLYSRMPWARNFTNPFAGEDKEQFDKAVEALNDKDFVTASEQFEDLAAEHPTQPPLAILAARAFAGAGDLDRAMQQLTAAVAGGWTSGDALTKDELLAPLKDLSAFKKLVDELDTKPTITQRLVAFDTARAWTANGWWTKAGSGGMTYLPSCMLAVNRGSGTTVEEAVEYLKTATQADNSFPDGTFYFTATSDVRTKTRVSGTVEALSYLRSLGKKAELVNTALPENKLDVLGVTFGTAKYDWPGSGSKFLPGAIGDNLTSTSGAMRGSSQTVLTELLKSGAAIASGTVTEPYALQFKFPLPLIHAFYAEGLTAIEAYYLSLASPYQLLIVGDPLCQPYARQPAEIVGGQIAKVNGVESLVLRTLLPEDANQKPANINLPSSPLGLVEFYVDGKLVHRTEPKETYTMKLAGLSPGSHEFRTVLIGEPTTAPRKSVLTWMNAGNLLPIPEIKVREVADREDKRIVKLDVSATSADSIKIMHYEEQLGLLDGDEGTIEIDVTDLGEGPIRLKGIAQYRGTEVPGREFVVQ